MLSFDNDNDDNDDNDENDNDDDENDNEKAILSPLAPFPNDDNHRC